MKQEGLKFFTDIHLTVLGLVIFFTFFVGVVLWVHRKASKNLYERLSELPLKEGENNG